MKTILRLLSLKLAWIGGEIEAFDAITKSMGLMTGKATPAGYQLAGSFKVSLGTDKHWAHPVISDGRLYIRHGEVLMAYDIEGKKLLNMLNSPITTVQKKVVRLTPFLNHEAVKIRWCFACPGFCFEWLPATHFSWP